MCPKSTIVGIVDGLKKKESWRRPAPLLGKERNPSRTEGEEKEEGEDEENDLRGLGKFPPLVARKGKTDRRERVRKGEAKEKKEASPRRSEGWGRKGEKREEGREGRGRVGHTQQREGTRRESEERNGPASADETGPKKRADGYMRKGVSEKKDDASLLRMQIQRRAEA